MSGQLRIFPVLPGQEADLANALVAALDGSGPPLAPVDGNLPAPSPAPPPRPRIAPAGPSTPDPTAPQPSAPGPLDTGQLADLALAVTTSGSTGEPRTVGLTRAALVASASATERRLGGAGQWLLALPLHHIAGLQVLTRSVLAGTEPVVMDVRASFTAEAFATATARLTGPRRYTSLVPTQLHRALATPAGREALASFDAILVGGAATSPTLLRAADEAGARIVRTYGMTETAGGCVYDGLPLDGVRVRLDDDGRIHLAGPVLAAGYLGAPELDRRTFVEHDGVRWLRTDDVGVLDDGTLEVLGRVDDVITTGGVKVAPLAVESALLELSEISQACVVGLPDEEWGAVVVGVVVLEPGAAEPDLRAVREHVAHTLGARAAPRRLHVVREIPTRGPGKPDRRAVTHLAAGTTARETGR